MNIQTSLSIFGLSAGEHSAATIKAAYKKSCLKYHPDRNPAGAEMMQAINEAWATLKDLNSATVDREEEQHHNQNYGDKLSAALVAVVNLNGVEIEVCGSWIWLTGNTKQHKDEIKAAGYFWAKKKASWYFRPADQKRKRGGKTWSMDKIRSEHGCTKVRARANRKIAA